MANPASIKNKGFDKNPQNINRNGRPRKGISLVNEVMKENGYEPAKKQDIEATYMQMIQLEESELKKLGLDTEKPMLVRILAKNILSNKGFEIIETMLDRALGKPASANDTAGLEQNISIVVKLPE